MDNHLTLAVAISTGFIGEITCIIAYSQMKIASAKVKLDLYERRFNVYTAALNCYQSLLKGQFEDILTCKEELIKSCRESKFLFRDNSEINHILNEMQKYTDQFLQYMFIEKNCRITNSPNTRLKVLEFSEDADDATNNFEKILINLEDKIKPHIQFENVKGWTFF
ncbi:unnamed protein product [Commensalibacter communis]|uniref:hypothetical protein n=1 Tax=Commensalibacter communis TaxID=2972786 RepID=UPI0022FFBA63|nr:hypothetical protein [Commensalibacter communis]CAI3950303.1 unnamed protein product [Commensalibacter communis]CAI3950429.1 unnamed protein product [Commensalibacter communis]